MSQNNFDFDFSKKKFDKPKFNQKMKSESKRQRKFDDIYGVFMDDMEPEAHGSDHEDLGLCANSKNYLLTNFMAGDTGADSKSAAQPTVTVHDLKKQDSEEKIKETLINEFTSAGKWEEQSDKSTEKKLEKDYIKKYGKGFYLLRKAGFKNISGGLGSKEQGILEPIEIKKRKQKVGISSKDKSDKEEVIEEEGIMGAIKDYDSQKMLGKKKKMEQRKADEEKQHMGAFKQFVDIWDDIKPRIQFDDRFEIEQLNFDYKKLLVEKIYALDKLRLANVNFSLDETEEFRGGDYQNRKEFVVQLMKKTKEKVKSHLSSLGKSSDSSLFVQYEKDKLNYAREEIGSSRLAKESFLRNLSHLRELTREDVDEALVEKFVRLYEDNKQEYSRHRRLTLYCVQLVMDQLRSNYSLEDYLKNYTKLKPLIKRLKELIYKSLKEEEEFPEDDYNIFNFSDKKREESPDNIEDLRHHERVYAHFLNHIVLSDLIKFIENIWNVKDYEKLIKIMQVYDDLLPRTLKLYIIDKAIVPKINGYLSYNWDLEAGGDYNNWVHLWLHPWLEVIPFDKFGSTFKVIKEKLENALVNWNLSSEENNQALASFLEPWRRIFSSEYIQEISDKYLVPKLTFVFSKFKVNPRNQELAPIKILFLWNKSILPVDKCVPILKKFFFPKWLSTLNEWLSDVKLNKPAQKEKALEEIQQWYQGWKKIFGENYLKHETIAREFKNALMLIGNVYK